MPSSLGESAGTGWPESHISTILSPLNRNRCTAADAAITWEQHNVGVNSHQVIITEHVIEGEPFVWEQGMVFLIIPFCSAGNPSKEEAIRGACLACPRTSDKLLFIGLQRLAAAMPRYFCDLVYCCLS